ncbi:hypothetical protein LSH36_121g13044 [Paralvinella palmiformis]|uniref:SAP domain-containing protein n=1 Tax=Paralvinella palmiformis TaxID=53620 RepID=A0AAD9NA64_9ANNE|nr:hypothetical protein LSH36_121g13044 [Paralvinella palmiformis]
MSKRKHSKDYGEMTIPLLKQELRMRKAKFSGKKHQLIGSNISGYDDQVRSIWLNSTATNPPIRQMYAPANVYAIANDHDYQDKSPEDMFLQSIHITAIHT